MVTTRFSDQIRKCSMHTCNKHILYNLIDIGHPTCIVFNPLTFDYYAPLFNFTQVGRASVSVMVPTYIHSSWLGTEPYRLLMGPLGFNW